MFRTTEGGVMAQCWWWALLFVVVAVVVNVWKSKRLDEAKAAYEQALQGLSADPENNDKRVLALQAGRAYAGAARDAAGSKGVAVFDEIALQNDLNARLGKGTSHGASSRVDQLARLAELRDKGVLTAEEFEAEKRKILG